MTDTPNPKPNSKGERIAKVMARAGLCSRREAERWIAGGRVAVNGEILQTPAFVVVPGAKVVVDGQPLDAPEATRLWRYHKPQGLLTTHRDPRGRPTVFEKLEDGLPRLISVGRLDMASEGLLLLTNNGELARFLELPSTGWSRRYRIRVHGRVSEEALAKLTAGITVSGINYGRIDASLERQVGANAWLRITLREGKNREVRRVMEHLGYQVNRLIRTAYGPFQLGKLGQEDLEEVTAKVGADQLPGFFEARGPQAKPAAKPVRRAAPTGKSSGPGKISGSNKKLGLSKKSQPDRKPGPNKKTGPGRKKDEKRDANRRR